MAGLSDYAELKILDHVFGTTTFTAPTVRAIQLHKGPPGEAGTLNLSAETTRQTVTFGAASGGAISSSTEASWSSYNTGGAGTNEALSHWSLWDATSGGNCLATGPLGTRPPFSASVNATNDTFTADANFLLAVNDKVEMYALPNQQLPSGLSANTAYTVGTVSGATFTLASSNITSNGNLIVQTLSPYTVYHADTVTVPAGMLVVFLD